MIYLNNNTDKQTIFIPRSSVSGKETIEVVKGYEEGFNEGYNEGQETQKDKLLNLYVTENGVYNREDGYGTITVDVLATGGGLTDEEKENINTAFEDLYNKYDGLQEYVSEVDEKVNTSIESLNTDITEITGTIEGINTTLDDIQENYLQKGNLKTVNGNVLIGEGDIFIESEGAKIIELTQEEYDNLTEKFNDTLYIITDAPTMDVPDTSNFATQDYVDEKIGNIETILDNIIGETNGGDDNNPSIFPLNN
jgi:hypothetical protein